MREIRINQEWAKRRTKNGEGEGQSEEEGMLLGIMKGEN